MKTKYYIHTLDGQPATFDGGQVCFASYYGEPNRLATSLKQIREEQQASKTLRRSEGSEDACEYGYRRYA